MGDRERSDGSRLDEMKSTVSGVDAATEARAIASVVEALEALDAAAVGRVLDWACKRYAPSSFERARERGRGSPPAGGTPRREDDQDRDLGALYSALGPSTDSEGVLAAAYWHQVVRGAEYLDSQRLNTDLKNLGHGIGNVTRACSSLIEQKPALMIQLKKTGSTKQARKHYRLTAAGIQRVRETLLERGGRTSVVR